MVKIIAIKFRRGDVVKTAIKRLSSVIVTFIFVYFIYMVSIILYKIGFDGASRDFFFIVLSAYLCLPLLKYLKIKKEILDKNLEENEKIIYEIKEFQEDADILEGVLLKDDSDELKIENLIITKYGVFNIVKCNYVGRISIKENRWYRKYGRELREIPSPIMEVRKNRAYLSKIFDEEQIIDVIVMVKDRVFVKDEKNSDVPVIRYSDLSSFIINYEGNIEWNKENLYDRLYKRIIKVNNIMEEEKTYNKFIDNRWSIRGRITFISSFFILYIIRVINM